MDKDFLDLTVVEFNKKYGFGESKNQPLVVGKWTFKIYIETTYSSNRKYFHLLEKGSPFSKVIDFNKKTNTVQSMVNHIVRSLDLLQKDLVELVNNTN